MKTYRNKRVASLINEELSKILQKEFDFGDALVTITSVEVKDDLSFAEIKIAILPLEKELEVYKIIEEEQKNIQRKLQKIINIKPMPHLKFFIEKYNN